MNLPVCLALSLSVAAACTLPDADGAPSPRRAPSAPSATSVHSQRDVPAFTSIDTAGAFEITLTVGGPTRLELDGEPELIAQTTSDVRDGVLHLAMTGHTHQVNTGLVHLTIATPHLRGLSLGGAVTMRVTGIADDPFALTLSGAGDVTLTGATTTAAFDIRGSGNVDATKLTARSTTISASGAAQVSAHATQDATISVSGVGSVEVYGHPAHVTRSVSGVGSITVH